MGMWRRLLLITLLAACGRSSSKHDPAAKDLSRALTPLPQAADTAAQRRQSEFERCKFVYHDEQGLRECLVLKNGWEPRDAALEIAIYKGEIARTVDSLRWVTDSLQRIDQARRQAAWRKKRVVDSIKAAPESARVAKERWDSAVAAEAETSRRPPR